MMILKLFGMAFAFMACGEWIIVGLVYKKWWHWALAITTFAIGVYAASQIV